MTELSEKPPKFSLIHMFWVVSWCAVTIGSARILFVTAPDDGEFLVAVTGVVMGPVAILTPFSKSQLISFAIGLVLVSAWVGYIYSQGPLVAR
jgi:hypothetical protein